MVCGVKNHRCCGGVIRPYRKQPFLTLFWCRFVADPRSRDTAGCCLLRQLCVPGPLRIGSAVEMTDQHGGGGLSTSLGSIVLSPSGQTKLLKSILPSVALTLCAHRLRLQKSS
jgi:hypothetical protein